MILKIMLQRRSIELNMECNICFEKVDDSLVHTTKCNHLFCTSCINTWTSKSNTCPTCRHTLFQSKKEVDWERLQEMIVPYITYVMDHSEFCIDPEVLYCKFYCFFNIYMKTMEGISDNHALFDFYRTNYQSYRNELYFVEVDFLENNEPPINIWTVFLNILENFSSNFFDIYICFNECMYFYCLKKGYTEKQIELFDQYKNEVHGSLLHG